MTDADFGWIAQEEACGHAVGTRMPSSCPYFRTGHIPNNGLDGRHGGLPGLRADGYGATLRLHGANFHCCGKCLTLNGTWWNDKPPAPLRRDMHARPAPNVSTGKSACAP